MNRGIAFIIDMFIFIKKRKGKKTSIPIVLFFLHENFKMWKMHIYDSIDVLTK